MTSMQQAVERLLDDLDEGDGALDSELLQRGLVKIVDKHLGIVLSTEESARALQWFDELNGPMAMSSLDQALAARLAEVGRA